MKGTAKNRDLAITIIFAAAASFMFIPLFVYRSIGFFDFWWWMSAALALLIVSGILADHAFLPSFINDLKEDLTWKIIAGLGAAVILFAAFFIGNALSRHLFSFAGGNINAIYGFKGSAAPLRILLLMALVIGPGEELFWRGFLQGRFSRHFGGPAGYLLATSLYTGVHAASGNIMLVLAALACGVFWGFLYYRYRSLAVNIVSHTVWDIAVFIIFPFTG